MAESDLALGAQPPGGGAAEVLLAGQRPGLAGAVVGDAGGDVTGQQGHVAGEVEAVVVLDEPVVDELATADAGHPLVEGLVVPGHVDERGVGRELGAQELGVGTVHAVELCGPVRLDRRAVLGVGHVRPARPEPAGRRVR